MLEGQDLELRLIDLESKISFQESELIEMSVAVMNQDVRIERLEATVRALRDKMKELDGEGQPPLPANERPPHY